MAIIGKPIHHYCKVFSFENLCDVLETLRPLGWAVASFTLASSSWISLWGLWSLTRRSKKAPRHSSSA